MVARSACGWASFRVRRMNSADREEVFEWLSSVAWFIGHTQQIQGPCFRLLLTLTKPQSRLEAGLQQSWAVTSSLEASKNVELTGFQRQLVVEGVAEWARQQLIYGQASQTHSRSKPMTTPSTR